MSTTCLLPYAFLFIGTVKVSLTSLYEAYQQRRIDNEEDCFSYSCCSDFYPVERFAQPSRRAGRARRSFMLEAAYGSGQDGGGLGDIRIIMILITLIILILIPIMLNRL